MNVLVKWVSAHPVPSAWIVLLLGLALCIAVSFFQGRELSLFPPRIGGKPLRLKKGNGTQGGENGVFDTIRARKSVRSYLDKPVEDEKLRRALEAARLAPSASNRQEWRFVLVTDKELLKQVGHASCIGTFIKNAPCIVAACAETDGHVMQCGQPSYPIDVAIALDHLSLAAPSLGLGTCWIGMFDEAKVKGILCVPEKARVVALMTLGYPADATPVEKKRLAFEKIVKYNRW